MIEVRLVLEDANERAGFNSFMTKLELYRQQKHAEMHQPPATAEVVEPEIVVETEIIPSPTTEEPVPSATEMVDALRNYLATNKLEKTQALLKEFGVSKVTEEMKPEIKSALYKRLTSTPVLVTA